MTYDLSWRKTLKQTEAWKFGIEGIDGITGMANLGLYNLYVSAKDEQNYSPRLVLYCLLHIPIIDIHKYNSR